jgi:predicted enzyme related to lactoylglutathione lyase
MSNILYSHAMTRAAVLIVAVVMSIGGKAVEQTKSQMPIDVGAGRVAWFDITATDMPRAKEFYGKLFGWTFAAVAGTDQAVEIVSRGQAVGTIRRADGAISGFNGVIYIQVDDVVKTGESAKALGATVLPGFPFNLPGDRGAISLFLDPSGHPLGVYSRRRIPGK